MYQQYSNHESFYIQQEDDTHDIGNQNEDFSTTIEANIFKNVIMNLCLLHEIENDFVCTAMFYKENSKSINTGQLGYDI